MAVGAWYIGWHRLEFLKGEKIATASSSAFTIRALFGKAIKNHPMSLIKWEKPPSDFYKINVDAYYFPNGSRAAAAVIRNHRGEVMVGAAWILNHILNAATAETIAVQRGLELAENLGCKKVIVDSDCLVVIQACNGEIDIWSPYTAILADIFKKAFRIGLVSFVHSPREANKVAQNNARLSFNSNLSLYWEDEPPSVILTDLIEHVTII